jgi:predicted ribosomally synthesized peptide with SipW-like signal peptide
MNNKIAAIFAIAIMALAATGTAYAAWTSTLNIDGSVTTGTVNVDFTGATSVDKPALGNVAITFPNVDTINVVVTNVYPGWAATIYVDVKNVGSLPVTDATAWSWVRTGSLVDVSATESSGGNPIVLSANQIGTIHVHLVIEANADQSQTATFTGTTATFTLKV